MKNGNLERAGKFSCDAYQHWRDALRNPDDLDSMRAGDVAWIRAEGALRDLGINNTPCTDEERDQLTFDPAFDPANEPDTPETPIDFKPLERSYRLSLIVKIVNYGAVILLIAGFAYLLGYGSGREAGAYPTGAQLEQAEKQIQQQTGE